MSGLTTVGVVSVAALMAPTFAVFASITAELAAEVTALLALEVSLQITLPTLAFALALAIQLDLALQISLGLTLPSLTLGLDVKFSLLLALYLGIVAAIKLVLAVGAVGGIEVLTYSGPGSGLGAAVGASPLPGEVNAIVLGATSSAAFAALAWLFNGLPSFAAGLNVIGEVTLAVMCSALFDFLLDLGSECGARASAALKASLSIGFIPPAIAGNIAVVARLNAKLQAALKIGMPSISADFIAKLQLRIDIIAALSAKIGAALSFATDGFDVFSYQGPGSGLGPALTSQLGGGWPDGAAPGAASQVVILAATTPEASTALSALFVGAA